MVTENSKPQTANRLFRIVTFGCKVNQVDSAGLAQELAALGWGAAPAGVAPNLILVNTCTVTARADQQARQAIRRLVRTYPDAAVWVTGCYAQRAAAEVAALPGVRAVLGNQEKASLADILSNQPRHPSLDGVTLTPGPNGGASPPSLLEWEAVTSENPASHGEEPIKAPRQLVGSFAAAAPFHAWRLNSFPGHTRAWLKIQEGCNHYCTYCIVPGVRGPRRSLAPGLVMASLQELAVRGYQEVVLTGVDLGQYGRDHLPPMDLAALVRRLQEAAWPFRVRLSSLEPMEVTGELLRELAAWGQFCPHFHLPLQSGAAPVLAAMGRPYNPGVFIDLVRIGTGCPGGVSGGIRRRLRGHPGCGGSAPGDLSPCLSLLSPTRHPRGANGATARPGDSGTGSPHAGPGKGEKIAVPGSPTRAGAGGAGGRAGPTARLAQRPERQLSAGGLAGPPWVTQPPPPGALSQPGGRGYGGGSG
jgi:tRNA A37 methylthiotransferase MiaB